MDNNKKPNMDEKQPVLNDQIAVLECAIIDMQAHIADIMTELKKAEKLMRLMVDTYPMCYQMWDSSLAMVDCNEAALRLFGFEKKQEYINNYYERLMPEYQPDGQPSREKAIEMLKKGFKEGSCTFEWVYSMLDGSLMPAEITLVRLQNHKGSDVLVGYTKDLRDIAEMENRISQLETEVDKLYYDSLTGIYNRRFFDENLERTVKTLSRSENGVFSLLLIDIDRFKEYNDTYGHSEGDKCLKTVAETIAQTVTRTGDFAARYGGEEFAVVLPNTDRNGAWLMAGKILENIMRCNIPHEKNDASDCVTISIGAATGKANHDQPLEYYIKAADNMLYKSKQNGRNQYTLGTFETLETLDSAEH